ncbi:ABC transporter ATP-binding protein, partial [Enterococcus faecalis]
IDLFYILVIIIENDVATYFLVTDDGSTASFCNRILFIKDGAIFSEVVRQGSRKEFINRVIDMQATIGGGGRANDF